MWSPCDTPAPPLPPPPHNLPPPSNKAMVPAILHRHISSLLRALVRCGHLPRRREDTRLLRVHHTPRAIACHAAVQSHQVIVPHGERGSRSVEQCPPMQVERCAIGQPQAPRDHMCLERSKPHASTNNPLRGPHGLPRVGELSVEPIPGRKAPHRVYPLAISWSSPVSTKRAINASLALRCACRANTRCTLGARRREAPSAGRAPPGGV